MDRSFGGAVVYAADGGTSSIDFVGENTFVLDALLEFDFFGFSYDPAYTDDSEVVVLRVVLEVVHVPLSLVKQLLV